MSDRFNSAHMDLDPKKITVDGHSLLLMEESAETQYCCKGCKEKDVRPCYKHGSYHLHRECYDSCKTRSIVLNLVGSNSSCEYAFHKEALGGKVVCEACGGDVKGWFFKCKLCKKPHYLHPCCAKLPPIKKYSGTWKKKITLDLRAKRPDTDSNCLLCGKNDSRDGFSGWHYISRCGTHCYHWSCLKQVALEKWKEDDGDDDQPSRRRSRERKPPPPPSSLASKTKTTEAVTVTIQPPKQGNQKQGHDAGKRSKAPATKAKEQDNEAHQPTQSSHAPKERPSTLKPTLGFTAEVVVEVLDVLFFLLDLTTVPLGLVVRLFK